MSETPARELEQSSLLPSSSCVSINSTPKNEDFSKVRLPFSTIRIPTQDQFAKNKIMELQEELIKLRKEYSQKQCSYSKQKNSLLNRIQLLSEQNTELKHRNENLTQLNLTLELAMNSQEQSKSRIAKKEDTQASALRQQMSTLAKTLKQYKTRIEEYKKYIRRLQQQKYQLLEEKDRKILELNNNNKQIFSEKEELQNKMKGLINKRYSNQEMVNAIQKALNNHTQDLSLDQVSIESNYFEESPIPKRKGQGEKRVGGRSSKAFDNSYSRISSRSFINELNHPIPSQCSYQEEDEPQQLLCQICRKVYEEQQFLRHMDQCREITQLHKKRQQLQKAISNLDEQQRKSISQRKWKQNIQQREPLQPVYYENYHKEKSQTKMMDKSPIRSRPEGAKKIVVQLNRQNEQGYLSNKFY